MIKSMTGYGFGEFTLGEKRFTAEIKSVNNRHRDIIVRLPKALQALEDEIRSRVSSRIKRGRIEVFIQIEKEGGEAEYDLELNLPLVRSYFRIFGQLSDEFGVEEGISPGELCQMRDVIVMKPKEVALDEARQGIGEALMGALDSCDGMRMQEGRAIEEDFLQRLKVIETYVNEIEVTGPVVVEEYRKRLKDKIARISQDMEIDDMRMVQEVAFFADRCDITEEIVRARSHFQQFRHYLSADDEVGRRLDFLLQEINREVNTMSSKSSDSSISGKTVEIKAELEKIREQVQNVE
ncbi:MAG: YicC family protein [Desulfobacterales bacterium]|nr:YicC family protein [Desulfobacterales bacterium]